MELFQITSEKDLDSYRRWIQTHPEATLWQSLERKTYLNALGKEVRIFARKRNEQICASALVVIDRTTGGYSTWDIPRGPIGTESTALLEHIIQKAKEEKCMALYFSPLHALSLGKESPRHIHCEATRIIDLTKSQEDILSQMKQKGRYNIRIAGKHSVTVKKSKDIDAFYQLVTQTGARDGFTHLSQEKYQSFLRDLPGSFLLMAYDKETKPLAGVLSVIWNKKGIYYYGASNHAERAKMAPYLLQWESMRYCKEKGCTSYDLLGVAPENASKNHPWAGITSFKEKFGGELVSYPAERIVVLKPLVYWALYWKRKVVG